MYDPVKPQDLKVVQGHSGRGLQLVCACGCLNWNHLESPEAVWQCRNCPRVFTQNFPALAREFLALEKQAAAPADPAAS